MDFNYTTGVDSNISRLTSISDASGTLEAYSYQGDGTVLERNHTQPGLNLTTTLDDFGRIIDFNWTNSGGSVSHYAYGYDPAGNRLYKEDLVNTGLSELYTYDGLSQLATSARGTLNSSKNAITGTPDFEQSWNHDALGNWDDVTTNGIIDDRDSNAQNEYTDVDGNIPAYDANGNMTTDQTGKHFVWDAWNRLVEVQDSSSTTLRTHTYDSLNRRVTSDDGTTVTTLYYSTGWQVLQEQVAGDVTKQYVYSPFYPDALILRDRDTDADGVLDERLWVIQDNNFNVLALTDNTGNVVERYKYTAFGVATVMDASYTVQSTSAYAWVHLHQGLRLEEASGLYDNRFRWCSAVLGQFVSNDPIGFDAGDVNVRRYVGNGAVGAVDPSGLITILFDGTGQSLKNDTNIGKLMKECNDIRWHFTFGFSGGISSKVSEAKKEVMARLKDNPNEQVNIFGWSRGGVAAVVLAEELGKEGITVNFVGLIDPCRTGISSVGRTASISKNVRVFWQGVKRDPFAVGGDEGAKFSAKDEVLFPTWKIYGNGVGKGTTEFKSKGYSLTHPETGFDTKLMDDMREAAKNAGVPIQK